MSRSSFLYGPFSIVWGGGAALGVAILQPLAEKSERLIFLGGFILGGAYEYLCSVFTEVVFGKVFWDYSNYPLNIGGRTNALFMFFWGIAAVILVKHVYPLLKKYIEAIPVIRGTILTWIFVVFMLLNAAVSGLALGRYSMRSQDPKEYSKLDQFLDTQYPDKLIENRWPNLINRTHTNSTSD